MKMIKNDMKMIKDELTFFEKQVICQKPGVHGYNYNII